MSPAVKLPRPDLRLSDVFDVPAAPGQLSRMLRPGRLSHPWTRNQAASVRALATRVETVGRLADLGGLTAGVLHELHDVLTCVQVSLAVLQDAVPGLSASGGKDGHLSLTLQDHPQLCKDLRVTLEETAAALRDITAVTHDLARIARPNRDEPSPTDLSQCVESALRVMQPGLMPGVRLDATLTKVPVFAAHPGLLLQLLVNLLRNASQAVGCEGTVRVHTSQVGTDAVIEVTDTGHGVERRYLQRVFDPLFTTRAEQGALGLGLTVCREIAARHRGSIEMTSSLGRGTTVLVRLPLADQVTGAGAVQ